MMVRKMGNLGWDVSILGFGCMRLPTSFIQGKEIINESEAMQMIRYGIDEGINYLDTGWPYHGGESELLLGKALQDGYREKIKLVTKCPIWLVQTSADFNRFLEQQLEKLQTSYIDIYLFHALNRDFFAKIKELGLFEKMLEAKQKGLIKHIGFSFHDDFSTFKSILDAYPWEVVQIQFNYVDKDSQATTEGLRYAAQKGLAIVIMEPLMGGKLVKRTPEIEKVLTQSNCNLSLAELALKYVWDFPEVSTILSGMSSIEQVYENINLAKRTNPHNLTCNERDLIEKLSFRYQSKSLISCTSCGYCLPCPEGVNIPENFALLNESFWENKINQGIKDYMNFRHNHDKVTNHYISGAADLCIACGNCLDKCPQQINIPFELQKVHAVLTGKKQIEEEFNLTTRGPRLVKKPSFDVVGLPIEGILAKLDISGHWAHFARRNSEIANIVPNRSWGITMHHKKPDFRRYLASCEVQKVSYIPEGMEKHTIPAQYWAIFTHIGSLAKLSQSMDYIFGKWILYNGLYRLNRNIPVLELYDERFNPHANISEMDIYVPIMYNEL